MKKRIIAAWLALSFLVITAGCGKTEAETETVPSFSETKTKEIKMPEKPVLKTPYAKLIVPDEYFKPCERKGRTEKLTYETLDYATGKKAENTAFVYLPYGYDSGAEYPVLYLLHGMGESAGYWLAADEYEGGYTSKTVLLLDNLAAKNECVPAIIVTPSENLNGEENFVNELIHDLIPAAETKYRTKAGLFGCPKESVTDEKIVSSRTYRAFAGLSLGSIITWRVLESELDKFAYFGFFSGGTCSDEIKDRLSVLFAGKGKYDILFAYHSCGTDDVMYDGHLADYRFFCNKKTLFRDKENSVYLVKPSLGHDYSAWIVDLYNVMRFDFFKKQGA